MSAEGCLPVTRDSEAFKKLLDALRAVIVGHDDFRLAREAEAEAAAIAAATQAAEKAGKPPPRIKAKVPGPTQLVARDASDRISVEALREVLSSSDGQSRALSAQEFNTLLEDLGVDPKDNKFRLGLVDIAQARHSFASLARRFACPRVRSSPRASHMPLNPTFRFFFVGCGRYCSSAEPRKRSLAFWLSRSRKTCC